MNSQLYTAASGMLVEERRLEMISNNLANLSTHGYRALRPFTVAVGPRPGAEAATREANAAVALAGAFEVPRAGIPIPTGRALDVALEPDALLAVRTADGTRYTRAGSLEVSPDGELTDALGNPLLNTDGKPLTGLGPNASIAADGRVVEGEAEIGRLRVVRHAPELLRREGDGLFSADGSDDALERIDEPRLQPGHVEGSGVDALAELVALVETQRAFESYQKLVSMTMNEVNRRAVNDLAG